jgi:hypothetical protein
MACPYFYPTAVMATGLWGKRSRLPLGDLFQGTCELDSQLPEEGILRDCCNLGYARHQCSRFPTQPGPDAVRFAVSGDDNGAVRICYVIEQDHRPHAQGALEYDRGRRAFVDPLPEGALHRQAEAYVASYLRRKPERA